METKYIAWYFLFVELEIINSFILFVLWRSIKVRVKDMAIQIFTWLYCFDFCSGNWECLREVMEL